MHARCLLQLPHLRLTHTSAYVSMRQHTLRQAMHARCLLQLPHLHRLEPLES
jgi:hypothetical protein